MRPQLKRSSAHPRRPNTPPPQRKSSKGDYDESSFLSGSCRFRGHMMQLSKTCLKALADNKEATKADIDKYLASNRKTK
jgi:hypothetical protein